VSSEETGHLQCNDSLASRHRQLGEGVYIGEIQVSGEGAARHALRPVGSLAVRRSRPDLAARHAGIGEVSYERRRGSGARVSFTVSVFERIQMILVELNGIEPSTS
jgi:hypothetical protein